MDERPSLGMRLKGNDMRHFFESYEWWKLQLANNLRLSGPNTTGKEVVVGKARDNSFMMAYSPYGHTFSLNMEGLHVDAIQVQWFHAATGTFVEGGIREREREMLFDPPGDPQRGNDWVMVAR